MVRHGTGAGIGAGLSVGTRCDLGLARPYPRALAAVAYWAHLGSRGCHSRGGLMGRPGGRVKATRFEPVRLGLGDRIGQAASIAATGRKSRVLRPLNTVRRLSAPFPSAQTLEAEACEAICAGEMVSGEIEGGGVSLLGRSSPAPRGTPADLTISPSHRPTVRARGTDARRLLPCFPAACAVGGVAFVRCRSTHCTHRCPHAYSGVISPGRRPASARRSRGKQHGSRQRRRHTCAGRE